MTLHDLLDQYAQLPTITQLAQKIRESDDSRHYHFAQTYGSQRQLLAAALLSKTQRAGVILLNEREAAIYAANELEALLPERRVLVFPASGKRPGEYENVDNANVLQRAEVLNAVNSSQPGQTLIVTYPEALLEKVVNRTALVQNTLRVEKGYELGQDFVAEVLSEYGFQEVSFVVEPGQYA
ncbi:MAG: transcription-repair coupling factor, partial [Bacteroidota bacterium]